MRGGAGGNQESIRKSELNLGRCAEICLCSREQVKTVLTLFAAEIVRILNAYNPFQWLDISSEVWVQGGARHETRGVRGKGVANLCQSE